MEHATAPASDDKVGSEAPATEAANTDEEEGSESEMAALLGEIFGQKKS